MSEFRTTPSLLSKYNACVTWAKHNDNHPPRKETSGYSREYDKQDPRWRGIFLHRILQYAIEFTDGRSFLEASNIVNRIKQPEQWGSFLKSISNDENSMNPIPLRTDLTDTEQQDLYSVLRGLEEQFSGAEIEAYCEKEFTELEISNNITIRKGNIDLFCKISYGGEEEHIIIDWKSSVPNNEDIANQKFGLQLDSYWKWLESEINNLGWSENPINEGTYIVPIKRSSESNRPIGLNLLLIDEIGQDTYQNLYESIIHDNPSPGPHCAFCELVFDGCNNDDGPGAFSLDENQTWGRKSFPKNGRFLIRFSGRSITSQRLENNRLIISFSDPPRELTISQIPRNFEIKQHNLLLVSLDKKRGASRKSLGVYLNGFNFD